MKTLADALGVARSNLVAQPTAVPHRRRGRRPPPEAELLVESEIGPGPNFGPKRAGTGRNQAGSNGTRLARKPQKTSLFGMRRNNVGMSRSLNNYGKVMKTELRRLLAESMSQPPDRR